MKKLYVLIITALLSFGAPLLVNADDEIATTHIFGLISTQGIDDPKMPGDTDMALMVDIDNTSPYDYKITNIETDEYLLLADGALEVPNNGYLFEDEEEAHDYFFSKCLLINKGGASSYDPYSDIDNLTIKAGERLIYYVPVEIAGYECGNTYQCASFDYSLIFTLEKVEPEQDNPPEIDKPDTPVTKVTKPETPSIKTAKDIPNTGDNNKLMAYGVIESLSAALFIKLRGKRNDITNTD